MSEPPLSTHTASDRVSPLSRFFFLETIFGMLLVLLLVISGLLGATSMVKEGDPDIDVAIASISTTWPGADPETIENQVTDELEKELKSLKGLKELSSASFDSQSEIVVEFVADAETNEAIAQVRAKVDEAEAELPEEAEKPTIEQISSQDTPILSVALYGDIDMAVLSRAADELQDLLERVPNVREVNLGGQREEVVHVQLIPSRLATLGISPTQVARAIQTGNRDVPWERIESDDIGAQVRFYGRFRSVEALKQLPVVRLGNASASKSEGRVVLLGEIAEVRRDLEREDTRAFVSYEGNAFQPTINVDIVKVPGSDTIQTIEASLEALEVAKADPNLWPHGMDYRVINTDADTILEDLDNLFSNAWQGVLAVFVVLLLALTWREAIIAGLSIPLTFLGALALLWIFGFTLNTMVQVGMILSLGLLVDVFILMMEGMHEGIFVQGLPFDRAAMKTLKTYALPAFSGQLTTILAMVPLMAIGGTMGKFVRLIPLSAIACLVLSYIIALFVDVPLSRFLLGKVKHTGKASRIDRLSKAASDGFRQWSLRNTVRNKATARFWTMGALSAFVLSVVLAGSLSSNLFPDDDARKLSVNVELPPTTTLETSQTVADEIGEILRSQPYLESVTKFVGQRSQLVEESGIQANTGTYLVGFSAMFTPQRERDRMSFEYVEELREALQVAIRKHPGASLVVNRQLTGEGGDPIAIEISGSDMDELRRISGEVQTALREIPGSVDVRDDLGALRSDIKLRPRREAIDFYGFDADDLAMQGRYLMTDNDIGDYPIGGGEEDLEIRLSTVWPSREGAVGGPTRLDELETLRLVAPDGTLVAGPEVFDLEFGVAPLSITHQDAQRTVTVLAKNKGRSPGEIVFEDLVPKLEELEKTWPQGYSYQIAGELETQSETFGSAGQMAMVAFFLVFSVLVIQFGSFTQPLIIMLVIPFALIGTFGGFFLLNIPISFPAVIGIIALFGIVVNNAIVMVETMNAHRENGMDVRHAAAHGVSDRLRPILTTSITTIVGIVPLALSDPIWFPLASAIGFGLVASTLIAMLVTPGLYLQLTPERKNKEAIALREGAELS
ncbi:efflux RND transporter permease subunit [Baaleninema simplex]|uniref:efflux RND transporter permease subunit n=1 Tax=Baaleninema simplex TaxID=2862350 RepID=UPI0003451B7B|nr:efflux RND transporter permease subunit [Baaleninema simplex]